MERDNLNNSVGKGQILHHQAASIPSSDSEVEDRSLFFQALTISRLTTISTSSSEGENEELFRHHQALLFSRIMSISPTTSTSSSDEWSTTSSGSASAVSMPLGCDHQVFAALQTNESQDETINAPPASAVPQPPAHWLRKDNPPK